MPAQKLPRIVGLLAFVGILWWVNQSAPRIIPGILVLLVLYAALTHVPAVEGLFGSAQTSVTKRFPARTTGDRPGRRAPG